MKIKITKRQYDKLLNEMRFDGKSTGLFVDEETKEVNEFFGEKVKKFVGDKKDKLRTSFSKFIEATKREGKETAMASNILLKLIKDKDKVTDNEIKFLKAQSTDLVKIALILGSGVVSSVIPFTIEKMLNKYGISIMPSSHNLTDENSETDEDLNEAKKKKSNKLCARGISSAKSKYDVFPSAYANGHAVQVCTGDIAGLDGEKRCSGSYCSPKKNESWSPEMSQDVDAFNDIHIHEDLAVWFGTKKKGKSNKQPQGPWVNICRKKDGGGHPECGRSDSDKGGYPVCRAKSVAANMSQSAKDSACRRKRDKEKNDGKSGKGQSPSPIKVKGYKPKERKSKKNESLNYDRMLITENRTIISEGLKYHIENQIPLTETVYRYGSESFLKLINEVRDLYQNGKIDLSYNDIEIIKTDIGKEGIYEGKKVWLDVPMEEVILYEAKYNGREVSLNSPSKKGSQNYVYVTGCLKDKSEVKKITYGSAMRDKLKDADRRKAFAARHGCEGLSLKDKCTKKYWACRKPKDFASVNAWW